MPVLSASEFRGKRTRYATSPLLKRRNRVNLVEHLQHDGVGCQPAVERDRQARPYYQCHVVDRIVAHERVVAGHLASVKIHGVRSKGDLRDPIPIFLAERLAWVLRLETAEP